MSYFDNLYYDIYPTLSGQLSFEWITYLPLNYWDIFLVHIYPTLSGHLPLFIRTIIFWVRDLFAPNYWDIFLILILKLTPFYRDTNPKIFVNSIKFVGNHTSKFHNQLVYNSNVLNFLPLNLLKGFSKPIHFLTFQRKFSKLL